MNGIYQSILESNGYLKKEINIPVILPKLFAEENITVKNSKDGKPSRYKFNFISKNSTESHGPRIKIIFKSDQVGYVPFAQDKDLSYNELIGDKHYKMKKEGKVVENQAIGFAMYGLKEAQNFYKNGDEIV